MHRCYEDKSQYVLNSNVKTSTILLIPVKTIIAVMAVIGPA